MYVQLLSFSPPLLPSFSFSLLCVLAKSLVIPPHIARFLLPSFLLPCVFHFCLSVQNREEGGRESSNVALSLSPPLLSIS